MHLTLSSTAVSPPPPPALLLLSAFQFATAALPSLFCTHTLSLLHCTQILPPPPPPLPFALFPLSVPLTPAEISILLVTTSRSRFRSQAQAATLSRRFVVCSLHANMPAEEGERRGGRGETENEAQTSQISPAVAKQFNHIAQKFEVSYKNKIHSHTHTCICLPLLVCACVALSLSLSRICFVLMSFFVFARITAGVARCPGSLAQKPLFPGRNRRDISSYPLPLYPLQASPGKPISTQCNPFPVCFIQVEVGHWSCV